MYNRGDYIIFSMKGRIADTIHDQVHGWCYIVECENPTNSVIRIPIGSVDIKFVPSDIRKHAPYRRPSSPNPVIIDGRSPSPERDMPSNYYRRDSFLNSNIRPRRGRPHPESKELAKLGCPFPPGYFEEYPEG